MSEQIIAILKRTLEDVAVHGQLDAETYRNALKEELQFYVLNFIYHHPEYSMWIMYGGSALRIIHGLNRMSVDLDFEVPHIVTEKFLETFKKELENHFINTYGTDTDFLTVKVTSTRGLILKFRVSEELSSGNPSKQVHVKIDLNHFVAPKIVTERRPINHDQLSFVILSYNMSAMMASKLAALFLRGVRGVGQATYEEKGRDIYDLLWYMNKKVVPDFDYLVAKGIDVKNPRVLFDKLTLQMNKVSDENLKQDLSPLFVERTFIENWLKSWRENYLRLLDDYKIRTVTQREKVLVYHDLMSDSFHFIYTYNTKEGGSVQIKYSLSDYWLNSDLSVMVDESLEGITEFRRSGITSHPALEDKLQQYATLFYQKTENYFNKTNRIILGDSIVTKLIRMTADKLNQKEQIVLNRSALLSCELDDLLR